MMRSWLAGLGLLVLTLLFTGCGAAPAATLPPSPLPTEASTPTAVPTSTPVPGPTTTPAVMPQTIASDPAEQSSLRVVHAAPDSPPVNVYVELLAVATNLQFGAFTDETPITAGEYNLRVLTSDSQIDDDAVLEQRITIQPAHTLMVLVTGTPDALSLLFVDQPLTPLSGAESRATFVHAVPRGPDFVVVSDGVEITPSLAFGSISPSQIRIPGVTQLSLQSSGAEFLNQTISLRPNFAHTLVLVGRADDPSSYMLLDLPVQTPGKARVRVLNASTIASVGLAMNGLGLGEGLIPGQSTDRMDVVANQYDVAAFTSAESPLQTVTVNLLPDGVYTLIIAGSSENLRIFAQREDLSPTPSGEARVTFVNTSASTPIMRILNGGGQLEGASDARFGEQNTSIALTAGNYSLFAVGVANGEPGGAVARLDNAEFEAGRSYLVAIPDDGGVVTTLSDGVGENAALVSSAADLQPSPTPTTPTTVRFINAFFDGTTLDFSVDDITRAAAVPFGTGSELITLASGDHTFTATLQGTGSGLSTETVFIENGTAVTLILYGKSGDLVKFLVVDDTDLIIDQLTPRLRGINLTTSSNQAFTLGFADPTDPPLAQGSNTLTTPTAETASGFIPLGVEQVGSSVSPGSVGNTISMPPGLRDLLLLDTQRSTVLGLEHSVLLEPGHHYDLLAYVNPGTQDVTAFIVPYPS